MRSLALFVGMFASWAGATAHAGFTLTVSDVTLDEPPAIDRMIGVELFFSNVTPDVQSKAAGWAVRADIVGGGAGTVRFPERRPNRVALIPVDHPYFYSLAGRSGDGSVDVERPAIPDHPEAYAPTTLIATALSVSGQEPPIILGEGVLRLPIFVPAGAVGVFPIVLDPVITGFVDPLAEPIPGLILDAGSITIVPEASTFGLLVVSLSAIARRPRRHAPAVRRFSCV